ncbi:cysteine peptidase family C39 domain-containing protein [Synechocystis sp. B12]|nr:cysteine peptidase family C39 domain-containing protein [Synechocystis sp. B12]
MAKYQWVQQQSGEDCAAASLAIIAKHHGRNIRINRIRALVGTRQGGTTLLGLKYGAQELGFITSAIQAEPEILDELDEWALPAIIFGRDIISLFCTGRKKINTSLQIRRSGFVI